MTIKKFSWGTHRNFCRFCGGEGHNKRTCREIVTVSENAPDDPFAQSFREKISIREMKRREAIAIRRKEASTRPKNKPKCGFCRSEGHTRRNCPKLLKFKKNLYKANTNWRKAFSEKVKDSGLAVGSLLKFRHSMDWSSVDHNIAMVTSFPFEKMTIFDSYAENWEYKSENPITVIVPSKVQDKINVHLSTIFGNKLFNKGFMFNSENAKVIAGKPMHIPEDWIQQDNIDSFEWLIKKHSLNRLEDLKIMDLVERWI